MFKIENLEIFVGKLNENVTQAWSSETVY